MHKAEANLAVALVAGIWSGSSYPWNPEHVTKFSIRSSSNVYILGKLIAGSHI